MSFENISTEIIKDSINSAIYIDDKILLPFEDFNKESEAYGIAFKLYNSFRENNCTLDFFRFDPANALNEKFLFYNRDLVILDWHLDGVHEDNLKPAFDIISKASANHNIHFCVIYTSEKETDLPEKVIFNIASYFSGVTKQLRDEIRNGFEQYLEDIGISSEEAQQATENLRTLFKELFFEFKNSENNKEISRSINEIINSIGGRKNFDAFLASFQFPVTLPKEKWICLGFILNDTELPDEATINKITISPDRYTIRINNLFIKVFSKDLDSSALYGEFKNSITTESNIFLTLLGLEMRNLFRESSGFIGRELEDVDHLAFFYHKQSHFTGHDELFYDFLKDMWKDQAASFLLERDIKLFTVIEEYKTSANIDEHLKKFNKSSEGCREALSKLNWVYNRLAVKRKENDEIRFGDVFAYNLGENEKSYLLCITSHCDCLRPEKIKNMYYFVEGNDIGITAGVNKGDGDFISFFKFENSTLICIDWTNKTNDCKPFSLYIPNNKMTGDEKLISTSITGSEKQIRYLGTLKENYAQRIANKAFFYPLRVGIDFASFQ